MDGGAEIPATVASIGRRLRAAAALRCAVKNRHDVFAGIHFDNSASSGCELRPAGRIDCRLSMNDASLLAKCQFPLGNISEREMRVE